MIGLALSTDMLPHKGTGEEGVPALLLREKTTVWGDSMSAQENAISYWMYAIAQTDGRLYILPTVNKGLDTVHGGNCGVGGQNSTQIAARAVGIAQGEARVFIGLMSQNDNVSVGWETIRDNFITVFEACHPTAVKHYVIPVAPTATVMNSATLVQRKIDVDAWLSDIAPTLYPEVVFLRNAWDGVEVASFNGTTWVAGVDSYDGTHENPQGAKKLGVNVGAAIKADMVSGTAYDFYTTGNLNDQSAMAGGTTGTDSNWAAGDTATGYTGTNTTVGAVVTPTLPTHDGFTWQRLEITGEATVNARIRLNRSIAHTYATGDVFVQIARLRASNIAGTGKAVGIRGFNIAANNGAQWLSESYTGVGTGDAEDITPFDYVVSSIGFAVSAGASTFTMNLNIQPDIGPTIDAAFEITQWQVFNLTQLGLA